MSFAPQDHELQAFAGTIPDAYKEGRVGPTTAVQLVSRAIIAAAKDSESEFKAYLGLSRSNCPRTDNRRRRSMINSSDPTLLDFHEVASALRQERADLDARFSRLFELCEENEEIIHRIMASLDRSFAVLEPSPSLVPEQLSDPSVPVDGRQTSVTERADG